MEGTEGFEAGGKRKLSSDGDSQPVALSKKLDTENGLKLEKDDKIEKKFQSFQNFEGFELKQVLSNSADHKTVIVEGKLNEQPAVIILDKKPFTQEVLKEFFSSKSQLRHTFQNDIYGSYDCSPIEKAAAIKTTIVYPATQKHIDKYIQHRLFLVDETPNIYEKVTLPYLESSSFNIQWVFNILEHKKESERIAYEDSDPETGFILLPDLKWDGVAIENLYLVAIVHSKGIKSLRDLQGKHIPLLQNIQDSGSKAIEEKYGVKRSQLRTYIHYQPSYYHLHVHFTALQFNAPGEERNLHREVTLASNSNLQHQEQPFILPRGNTSICS